MYDGYILFYTNASNYWCKEPQSRQFEGITAILETYSSANWTTKMEIYRSLNNTQAFVLFYKITQIC
jgi:hypothetical protein